MNTQNRAQTTFAALMLALMLTVALLSFPGVGDARTNGTESNASTTRSMNKQIDATCMSGAVDTREEALMDAWEEMSSSTLAALKDRKEGLHAAWEKTTVKERTLAVVKVWKEWRSDKKAIATEFRKDRKAAWDAFKKTAKDTCKTALPKEETQEKATSDSIAI